MNTMSEKFVELVEREAELLDDRKYVDWLDLYTNDSYYWVPLREAQEDPAKLNLIYDDRRRMEFRIERLTGGFAHAQLPPSRTTRVISNFKIGPEVDGVVEITSKFVLFEVRREVQTIFGGRYAHRIRPGPGGLRICSKRVDLVNSDTRHGNLTFIL